MSPTVRNVAWGAVIVVVVALLTIGSVGGEEPTLEERAQAIEATIRCPSCASQSVAHSDTPSARGVKVVIRDRLAAGDTDEEIRDYIASRYPEGRQLLLDPAGSGFGALVWALPVMAVIGAVAGLVMRFRDWRPSEVSVSDSDRQLVAAALGRSGSSDGGPGADGAEPSRNGSRPPGREPQDGDDRDDDDRDGDDRAGDDT